MSSIDCQDGSVKPLFHPSLSELKGKLDDGHRRFPLGLKIDVKHMQWYSLFQKVSRKSPYHFLLESGRSGRYSFIAYQPFYGFRGKNKQLISFAIDKQGNKTDIVQRQGALLEQIKEWMKQNQAPFFKELPDFKGGLLGFFSYDLIREIEQIPEQSKDDLQIPDLYLLACDQIIVYDHQKDEHWLFLYQSRQLQKSVEENYHMAADRLTKWWQQLKEELMDDEEEDDGQADAQWVQTDDQAAVMTSSEMVPSFTEKEFVKAVGRVQEYIAAGDVFQVNLSVRQERPLHSSPIDIYTQLRQINPSPYMGYLHFPELQIISASPEQLVKVKERKANTRPIAGTRSRGKNREEDLRLAQELTSNEKERAEHVMLVDLERNDLGKVCQFGSVEVNEFMVIEEYSHVMHIVSNVRGILREHMDAFDVIKATFPGGTITGAPKVRTMEIIEELEPVRRGIYTGSIGWLDFNGDMELNIVIRTMVVQDGQAYLQAGAGIVIDSIPENEYKESLKKAKALWLAFEQSKRKMSNIYR